MLTYVRFIDALSKQHDLHIHLLSTGKRFFYAKINGVNYKTGFDSIDNEIDFLERLCDIEDYLVPSSIMRKFIYKSGRTQSAQGRETCP